MPAIITDRFRIHNSEQFQEAFSETSGNAMYLGIGRPQAFATSTRADGRTNNEGSDTAPITPADNLNAQHFPYDDLLACKKIAASDVTFAIPRRNWVTGTTYDIYRHDYGERITGTTTAQTANSGVSNLHDASFYVLTAARNVYKCLDNDGNTASTVEPTGTSTSVLTTADGYKWKYMYTLTASQQSNFLSTDFMAVSTNSTVSAAAVDGAINICKIKTAGSGGTDGTFTGIPIRGDGTGAIATVVVSSGAVTSVTMTSVGSGYTYGYLPNAKIVSNGSTNLTGAEIDVIIEPKGGHGFNAVEELGGFFIMLNASLEGTESANSGDVTVANDFRKVALLKDPKTSGNASTATTMRATKAIKLSGVSGTFQADEKITQATTNAVGKVVEWDATNSILYYVQTRFLNEGVDTDGSKNAFSTNATVTGATSSATGNPDTSHSATTNNVVFASGYATAEIDSGSGQVLYVENRAPITRAADQTENIKLIVEF